MGQYRNIIQTIEGSDAFDGAGVKLKRIFGYHERGVFDPFLLLDFFGSDKKDDYIKGFPWHPHRGIETVTYMLDGNVAHGDSIGNSGVISKGDVQWMTAGSGIIHQEMPKPGISENMFGFQLWVNLSSDNKMTKPKYREIKASTIPVVELNQLVSVKVIAGEFLGTKAPISEMDNEVFYYDFYLPCRQTLEIDVADYLNCFTYVYEGSAVFGPDNKKLFDSELGHFSQGSKILIKTEDIPVRFLLVGGKPLNEPIAWGGPIVMNTKDELLLAFKEYNEGSFIK